MPSACPAGASAPSEETSRMGDLVFCAKLDADAIGRHVRQSHDLWGGGASPEARESALTARLAAAGPGLFYMSGLIGADGRLAASLKRYYFDLSIGGQPVRTIGLGAIVTDPALRRQGLAARLIAATLEQARTAEGCGAALLFSDIGSGYYARFGFSGLPCASWTSAVADLSAGDPGLDVRAAGAGDTAALINWHAATAKASGVALYPRRVPETLALFSEINGAGKSYFLSEGGRDVGYITMAPGNKGVFWVDECCAPGVDPARIRAVVRRAAMAQGCSEAAGWWLPGCGMPGSRPRERAVPMLACLDGGAVPDGAFLSAVDHF